MPHNISVLIIFVLLLSSALATSEKQEVCSTDQLKVCSGGVQCIQLTIGEELVVDCHLTEPENPNTNATLPVLMLHGFPEWSGMYLSLMKTLASNGFTSLACNQRGYSPTAAPEGVLSYNHSLLVNDVFAMADAAKFDNFHLVAHDIGAIVGWQVVASDRGHKRVKSFSALSIPHVDAFSAGLYGETADVAQQMASQYFSMFVLPNSASIRGNFWYRALGRTSGRGNEYVTGVSSFSAKDFQKALYWYNGAKNDGILAFPPNFSWIYLAKAGMYSLAFLRIIFGGEPNKGIPASNPIGNVYIPSLFVCGSQDPSILCNRDYALKTKDYCKGGYQYVEVDCAHELLACSVELETEKVVNAIVGHIMAYGPKKISE